VAPATVSVGWLWKMRPAIVARVHNCSSMEIADDLGHRSWRLLPYGHSPRIAISCAALSGVKSMNLPEQAVYLRASDFRH